MMRLRTNLGKTSAALLLVAASLATWHGLPDPLFSSPLSAIVLARDGSLLGARIADDGQWRFPGGPDAPEKFRIALATYEDKRFDSHPGIDPFALARALRLNFSQGRVVSGASTITMQTIRLIRNNRERSISEKLIEMLLALRLELQYSKREIFALYAANAPFGGNVVGLEAASWRYFGRKPDQLSWAEICTLAVLPNSPSLIHPGRNRDQLKEKRNRLLHRLYDNGHLSAMSLKLALLEPLPQEPLPLPQFAPHLIETLRVNSPDTFRFDTTLDPELQRAAAATILEQAKNLERQDIHNIAGLIVDNRSFEVLAYVGNPRYAMNNEHGYAVDIIRRPRSSGSILKPLLFAAMLDAGELLPRTLVADIPTQYGGYMPENYDHGYRGAIPAEAALAQSLNVPSVRMLKRHGTHRFYSFLQHLGMASLNRDPDAYGLSLILGGAEVTLWEVAHFYANLANIARASVPGGSFEYRKLHLLGGEESKARARAEISPGAAWLTLNTLLEVARPNEEGYWKNFASSRKIAWKTGTSWGLRDAWAVGNSSHYTVAVWAGNASGEGRPGLTGSAAAAPALFALFNRIEPSDWFPPPMTYMKEIDICRNDGYLPNGYCQTEKQLAPRDSTFDQISPHHVRLHLDRSRRYRVHSGCERVATMEHADWFLLPPAQEFYYRRHHAEYRAMPPYRKDCDPASGTEAGRSPLDFLYPQQGARIYIPIELTEKKGHAVFEAVHRERDSFIHWHLDDQYLGSTRTFHQLALDASPGWHTATIVDQEGNRQSRRFEVLTQE